MLFSVILYFYACLYIYYIYTHISTPLVFGVLHLYNYIYCILLYYTLPFFDSVLMDVVVHCGSIGDPIFDPGIHIATAMSPWPGWTHCGRMCQKSFWTHCKSTGLCIRLMGVCSLGDLSFFCDKVICYRRVSILSL